MTNMVLDQSPRRQGLTSAKEVNALVKKTSLSYFALTAEKKVTSLVSALSQRRYFDFSHYVYVSSHVLVAHSFPMWTIDSVATKHIYIFTYLKIILKNLQFLGKAV